VKLGYIQINLRKRTRWRCVGSSEFTLNIHCKQFSNLQSSILLLNRCRVAISFLELDNSPQRSQIVSYFSSSSESECRAWKIIASIFRKVLDVYRNSYDCCYINQYHFSRSSVAYRRFESESSSHFTWWFSGQSTLKVVS